MPMEIKGTLSATAIRAGCFTAGFCLAAMAWATFTAPADPPVEQHTFVQPAGEASSSPAKIPTTLTVQSADEVEVPGPGDEGTIDPTTQNPPDQPEPPSPSVTESTPPADPTTSPEVAPTTDKVWGAGETPGTGNGTITAHPSATASDETTPPITETPTAVSDGGE